MVDCGVGVVWYCSVGNACIGMVWPGVAWCGVVRVQGGLLVHRDGAGTGAGGGRSTVPGQDFRVQCGIVWHSWHGIARYGMVWYGVVWV